MHSPVYLLAQAEACRELRDLDLPVEVISLQEEEGRHFFSNGDAEIPQEKAHLYTLCHVRTDPQDTPEKAWMLMFGSAPPRTIDFSSVKPEKRKQKALEAIVSLLKEQRRELSDRNVRLMRELGLLRQEHDRTQFAAQRLESLFYDTVKGERQHDFTLAPVSGHQNLILRDGENLEQRLPGSSVGLSDIALKSHHADVDGMLVVSLRALEEPGLIALWEVPGSKLDTGWTRLSLDRALGGDQVSLILSMEWRGHAPLGLAASVAHPDDRFLPRLEGVRHPAVLAMQGWRYIAGNEAPVPVGAVMQSGGMDKLRRVDFKDLKQALNLKTLTADVPFIAEDSALQVHVLPDEIAAAVLRGVAVTGAKHLYCNIFTRHKNAAPIEYAIALRDRRVRSAYPDQLPDFAKEFHSGWVKLQGGEASQLHIMLENPLEHDCDVYMMTRLPDGEGSTDFGWSCFSDICVRF